MHAPWLKKQQTLTESPMNRFQTEAQTDWRFPEGVVYKSSYELALTNAPKIATAHASVYLFFESVFSEKNVKVMTLRLTEVPLYLD